MIGAARLGTCFDHDHVPAPPDEYNIHKHCHANLADQMGCSLHEPIFDKFHAWVLKTLDEEVTLDNKT